MGTTFIKLGQFLATRPDIIGENVSKELEKLQDKLPSFDLVVAKNILKKELDKEKRKVSLSIKALEEKQTKEAVKKYGSKDSGGVLGEILGPFLKKK